MKRTLAYFVLWVAAAGTASAQNVAVDQYLTGANLTFLSKAPAARTNAEVNVTLPLARQRSFADYVAGELGNDDEDFKALLNTIEGLRLNKIAGNNGGATGVTSLLSRVAAPAVLGVGVEYGGILQQTTGTTTTLRANLLGVAKLAVGGPQFEYCPALDTARCNPASRQLRRFSASMAFQNTAGNAAKGLAAPVNGLTTTPVITDLFESDYRMANWGIRFDLTPSNNLDDPAYQADWKAAIVKLRKDPTSRAIPAAVQSVFDITVEDDSYGEWQASALKALKAVPDAAAFRTELANQLQSLIDLMKTKDPNLKQHVQDLRKAYSNYFLVRDDLLQKIQRHKMSLEYTNQHPQNQPNSSNIRFVYSHQPTKGPVVITLNAAADFYHAAPNGTSAFRDLQIAGQLDRRLGQVANFGQAVLTIAGYYQWMKEDALIEIPAGNIAPGAGIVLPGTAAKLLGTKGNIGIGQIKFTLPMGAVIKVPFSVTVSNRTELIKEKDVRGQVGMTFDLDTLFQ